MENVRNYIDIKLVAHEDKIVKLARKHEYAGFKVIGDMLWAVKMKRSTVNMCKPIYVGFTVLELSKLLMYNFQYKYVKQRYGAQATLLMTDTDSLMYHIHTNDIYEDMRKDAHPFDLSEYPTDHKCYDSTNKKVMGVMKDEMKGIVIDEFVGLRSKMYSIEDQNGKEKKRCKGVQRSVVSKDIRHEMYKHTLFTSTKMRHLMHYIRTDGGDVRSIAQNKCSLSAYDDKRYILGDGYSSLAYGHRDITMHSKK